MNYTCGECGTEYYAASDALDCEARDRHPGLTTREAHAAEQAKGRAWLAARPVPIPPSDTTPDPT